MLVLKLKYPVQVFFPKNASVTVLAYFIHFACMSTHQDIVSKCPGINNISKQQTKYGETCISKLNQHYYRESQYSDNLKFRKNHKVGIKIH